VTSRLQNRFSKRILGEVAGAIMQPHSDGQGMLQRPPSWAPDIPDGVDRELGRNGHFGGIVLGESSAINAHHDKRIGQQTVRLLERAHVFISS
jgi:hypothetical protein